MTLQAVDLLRRLLEHPSPTGDVDAARSALDEALSAHGFDPWVDGAGNLRARAGEGSTRVLLCGHVDTVPGGPDVREAEGWLWGRGTVDAKGPLAVLASALAALKASPTLDLRFAAVPDEEESSHGARHLAGDLDAVDAVVVGEPNRARGYALGYRGRVHLEARAASPPRHAAGPEPTAPDRLHDWWTGLRAWCREQAPDGGEVFRAATATLLDQGASRTPDRDEAWLEAEVRLPPGFDRTGLRDRLASPPAGVDVTVHGTIPAVEADSRGPLATAFRGAIREAGLEPRPVRKTGTCDLNVLVPALEAPGLAYGPGESRFDHRPDERVRLEAVRQAEAVLPAALRALPTRLRRAEGGARASRVG